MTSTTQWLYRAWKAQEEIAQLEELLEAEREKAEKITAAPDSIVVSSSSDPHKFDSLAVLSDSVTRAIHARRKAIAEITDVIERVENANYRLMLRYRLLECKDWNYISNAMHYSDRHCRRLWRSALSAAVRAAEQDVLLCPHVQ